MDDKIKLSITSNADIFLRQWKAILPGKVVNKLWLLWSLTKGKSTWALLGQLSRKKWTVIVLSPDFISNGAYIPWRLIPWIFHLTPYAYWKHVSINILSTIFINPKLFFFFFTQNNYMFFFQQLSFVHLVGGLHTS